MFRIAFVLIATLYATTFDFAAAQFSFNVPSPYQPPAPAFSIGGFVLSVLSGGIGGVVAGVLLSPPLARFRAIIIVGALGVAITVVIARPTTAGELVQALATAAAFVSGAVVGFGLLPRRPSPKLTTFGSAEWADHDHLAYNGMFAGDGFWLGQFPTKDFRGTETLRYNGDRHLLTIAPTRAGKGVSSIIPNLLTYEGSALVIDPKGENALITASARHQLKHKIFVVDPWKIVVPRFKGLEAARFNPLDWLQADDSNLSENAMILADALVVPTDTADKNNPFWDEESKALLMGLILYVATDPNESAQRTLPRVRDLLMQADKDLEALFERMKQSPHPVVAGTGARSLQKNNVLLGNVLASTQAHTHFLDSPSVRESLSHSDFRFEDMKSGRMTVYLVLPADRLHAFGRWLRLLIQQAITVNARNIDRKPNKPILFLLDEMPALGRLAMVEQAYSLMAGFGMQLWGIVQDASQLKRIYGDGWETFISNSGVLQYFGSRDVMTAGYFSKLCGVTTIRNTSSSWSSAFTSSPQGGSHSNSTGENVADAQRNLAYPDELMTLRKDKQLLLVENFNPISATKIRWFADTRLKDKGYNLVAGQT